MRTSGGPQWFSAFTLLVVIFMTVYEICILVFAVFVIVLSFFMVDPKKNKKDLEDGEALDIPELEKRISELTERASGIVADSERAYDDLENRMNRLTNEKIMAVSEFSEQVVEKIDANHKEAVFLYNMMKTKDEELKDSLSAIDVSKGEIGEILDETERRMALLKKSMAAVKKAQDGLTTAVDKKSGTKTAKASSKSQNTKNTVKQGTASKDSSFTEGIAAFASDVADGETAGAASPVKTVTLVGEQSERNEKILELHRQKKSVLEISKQLGLGQGEVKLVIDLYGGM